MFKLVVYKVTIKLYRVSNILKDPVGVGRHTVACIATVYGLEGPGIEARWGRDFPHPSRPALGPTQPPVKWVLGLFPGGGG